MKVGSISILTAVCGLMGNDDLALSDTFGYLT